MDTTNGVMSATTNGVMSSGVETLEAIDLSSWEKVVTQIAKDLRDKKYKPEDLNPQAVLGTYNELNKAAKQGYGKQWADFSSKEPNTTVLALQENLYRFSGAKTYAMQLEIQSKMHEGGKLRPYADFEKDVLAINEKYNRNYLQAEWQTARQGAHHARKWEEFQANKDLFPNLKYKTAGDDRVRKEHDKLADIVKSIDDPFWDSYYPPNGWRCRCYVVQTAEPASKETPQDDSIKPEFRVNVGKNNALMSEKHPYFSISKDTIVEDTINKQIVRLANEQALAWAKKHLVEPNKKIRHEKLEKPIVLSNTDVKTVLRKPHKDRVERAWLIKDLVPDFADATFIKSEPEGKGRPQYVMWYYFKSKQGDYYYNVVETYRGEFKLHAITDGLKE